MELWVILIKIEQIDFTLGTKKMLQSELNMYKMQPCRQVHTEDMKETENDEKTENDQEANKNHEEYDDYGYPVESEHAAGSEHPQSRS